MTVVSVTGTCDAFGVVFIHRGGNTWTAEVPMDTDDGIYVTSVTAVNDSGVSDIWTGLLYVYDTRPVYLELQCDGRQKNIRFESPSLKAIDIDEIVLRMKNGPCTKY